MSIHILVKDHHPQRSIALVTNSHTLIFRHSPSKEAHNGEYASNNSSFTSMVDRNNSSSASSPRCMVELAELDSVNLSDYKRLTSQPCFGTLGLITLGGDIFICVITSAREVATVRPGETVLRIHAVQFHCLSRSDFDDFLDNEVNPYSVESDGWDQGRSQQPVGVEHPCLALKKLLSDGTFYYSRDFDLTNRLQDRSLDTNHFDIDNFDDDFLWNSYMIKPLLKFRSRLSESERTTLDFTQILTSTIRGFVKSLSIPRPCMEGNMKSSGLPTTLALISRLSCRRAGTRFNSRGIDDDGHVANFVETETVVWDPGSGGRSLGFSYCQIRGSIPIFWEQQTGLLPGQQKIQITRSPEATQPAFDKHLEAITLKYGATHIINLLSETKPGEVELSTRYIHHIKRSELFDNGSRRSEPSLLTSTEFDFHAETKGPGGFEAANTIRRFIGASADSFSFFLMEGNSVKAHGQSQDGKEVYEVEKKRADSVILQQEGVFRTNCLDCLDRTNLVQGIVSRMALELCFQYLDRDIRQEFWMRHSTLWADNGDALSKIYAGTGALKSSFTRTGKMSLAGAIADARKSATRIYINNFADKDRQNTIDILLGRLVGQEAAYLYDPINDYVMAELNKRSAEYSYDMPIHIYVGTFNLNGRTNGCDHDLSGWLCPPFAEGSELQPELVVVGFQEIVELSPQQIMSTDPARRAIWEKAVLRCLNKRANEIGGDEYILLRGGQLVGAALLVFVKSSVIGEVKNVEGSLKKTGMSGVAGNKGAVAIRMDYASTGLCFVTAHLAAGFSNYEERNRDYRTISRGLRFQRGRMIDDHDAVIWLGDFNYRIGLPDEKVRKLIEIGDLQTLRENDQLNLQMVEGLTFLYYSEMKLQFEPTYKYDIGTDRYDTSEKARIPAWCDRILKKGKMLKQLSYNCAPLQFSDHRPVYATFSCTVSVVNEVVRDKMSREIYLKRKGEVGKSGSNSENPTEDEEDLLDFEPLEPGLPPPSSERRRWWLDNGMPAKSTVKPPGPEFVPNPERPTNPFTDTSIPDWVKKTDLNLNNTASRSSPNSSLANIAPSKVGPRNLPPPYNPSDLPLLPQKLPAPLEPIKRKPVTQPLPPVSRQNAPEIPISSRPSTGKLQKPLPPAVPKKPAVLSARDNQRSSLDQPASFQRSNLTGNPTPSMMYPPPPRRVGTTPASSMGEMSVRPIRSFRDDTSVSSPALPARRQVDDDGKRRGGLMDDDEDDISIQAWQPLKPA